MLRALLARFRERYQLPDSFTLDDLRASWKTHPVPIGQFSVTQDNPFEPPTALADLAEAQQGPPFLKWWQYFEAYDRELGRLALASREQRLAQPVRLLEIGVWKGGSLEMWREFFGPSAVIFGVDIDPECANLSLTGAQVRIGSQVDLDFMTAVIEEMGGVDVIIDDGSHMSEHVITTLRGLWPQLAEGGRYIIEDLHTSYWPAWGGGLRRPSSSVESLKRLADVLHQPYFATNADNGGLGIERETLLSLTFYDSVAVLNKRRMPPPQPFRGGTGRTES